MGKDFYSLSAKVNLLLSLFLSCVHFFTRRLLSLEMMIQYALVRVCIIYLLSSSSLQTYYYSEEDDDDDEEEEEPPKEQTAFFNNACCPFCYSLGSIRDVEKDDFAVQIYSQKTQKNSENSEND